MSKKTALLVAVTLSCVAADQLTKYLAVSRLTSALDGRAGVARAAGFFTVQHLDGPPRDPRQPRARLREHRFLEDYWHFRYVENPGAAWGTFADLPDGLRRPFFFAVTVVALAFILWMYRRVAEAHRFLQWALALVMGGAWGNFIDRVARGYVIDFIDWHWRNQPGMRWPTFNVADAAISVGVAMLVGDALLLSLRLRRARARQPLAEPAAPLEPRQIEP